MALGSQQEQVYFQDQATYQQQVLLKAVTIIRKPFVQGSKRMDPDFKLKKNVFPGQSLLYLYPFKLFLMPVYIHFLSNNSSQVLQLIAKTECNHLSLNCSTVPVFMFLLIMPGLPGALSRNFITQAFCLTLPAVPLEHKGGKKSQNASLP